MAPAHVPTDIIESIVDELEDDVLTLQQCSIVSPAFLAASRRCLFADIILSSSGRCERLLALFSSKPMLIRLVKNLFIFGSTHWAHMHAPFQSIIRAFADRGAVKMFHFSHYHDRSILPSVPFPRSSAMMKFLKSPSLNHVSFDQLPLCSFPIDLLMVTPSLRDLLFTGEMCTDPHCHRSLLHIPQPPLLPPACRLRVLDVRCAHSRALMRYIWASLSELRVLHTFISFGDQDGATTDSHQNPINLRLLQNLRLIIYDYILNNIDILSTIRTSGLPNSIEYIAVVFPYHFSHKLSDPRWDMERHLAAIFTTPHAYPHLRAVYFILLVEHRTGLPYEPSAVDAERFFPFMRRTGLLRCLIHEPREVEPVLNTLEERVGIKQSRQGRRM